MNTLFDVANLSGRVLLAAIFVLSGISKITGYEGTQAYMDAVGVPGALLPLVIATELAGGILIVLGLWTRLAALALAGFTVLAALLFHANFADPMQTILFMKNLAIAGAFLVLVARGAGPLSIDARRVRA
jgi:putative oxidoreductase